MGERYKSFQKNYPRIILSMVAIVLVIVVILSIYEARNPLSEALGDIFSNSQTFFVFGIPIVSVISSVITVVKFRNISRKSTVEAAAYLKYSLEIKKSHKEVHQCFLFFGIVGVLCLYGALISLTLLFAGAAMLFQTGYISSIGIEKLYSSDKIDWSTCIKYKISQYILFSDVKTLSKICDEYCEY